MAGEVLSDKQIKRLIEGGAILNADPNLINPSSLDLRISNEIWRTLGTVLPLPGQSIKQLLESSKHLTQIPGLAIGEKIFLDKNQPYLFRIIEELNLPQGISAKIFNKSSRGRVGISVKGLTNGNCCFDRIDNAYSGKIYAEICATSFSQILCLGKTAIPQIRFYNGMPQPIRGFDLSLLLKRESILLDKDNKPVEFSQAQVDSICNSGMFTFTADLSGNFLVYRARKDNFPIDLEMENYYDSNDFFEEVKSIHGEKQILIHPGELVLIKSKEKIQIPPYLAAEIVEHSAEIGDIKCHYAGLINPGHGYSENKNAATHIVFEVRARDMPILIQHGQPLAKFELYKMLEEPEIKYMTVKSTGFDSLPSILPKQFKKEEI